MQISTKGRYGLRAIVDLAMHNVEGPLALRVIAERQGISESYLEQVFTSLRKAGLVRASRGAQGGYELGRPATEITAGDILRALEGPITPVSCLETEVGSKHCEREKFCSTRWFWIELKNQIDRFLDSSTLQDLVDRAHTGEQNPMYYI